LEIIVFRILPEAAKPIILRIVFIFIVITFLPIGNLAAFEKNLPFYAGETLTFQLKWSMIPVGEAVLNFAGRNHSRDRILSFRNDSKILSDHRHFI
jgi:hypothetical protein